MTNVLTLLLPFLFLTNVSALEPPLTADVDNVGRIGTEQLQLGDLIREDHLHNVPNSQDFTLVSNYMARYGADLFSQTDLMRALDIYNLPDETTIRTVTIDGAEMVSSPHLIRDKVREGEWGNNDGFLMIYQFTVEFNKMNNQKGLQAGLHSASFRVLAYFVYSPHAGSQVHDIIQLELLGYREDSLGDFVEDWLNTAVSRNDQRPSEDKGPAHPVMRFVYDMTSMFWVNHYYKFQAGYLDLIRSTGANFNAITYP